jgi:hypothetical protein
LGDDLVKSQVFAGCSEDYSMYSPNNTSVRKTMLAVVAAAQ